MSKVTQGTNVYIIDPDDLSLITVECATDINPGTSPKSQNDDTCLEATERSYKPGIREPGQGSLGLNADPTNDSHIRMHEMYEDDTIDGMRWAIGWSDGTAAPTVDSNGDFVFPTTRTFYSWNAYIADFPFDFQQNTVVKSQVSLQRTQGDATTGWHKKTT